MSPIVGGAVWARNDLCLPTCAEGAAGWNKATFDKELVHQLECKCQQGLFNFPRRGADLLAMRGNYGNVCMKAGGGIAWASKHVAGLLGQPPDPLQCLRC